MIGVFILRPLGVVSLVAGLITLPLPLPTGVFLIAGGLILLIYSSRRVASIVRLVRMRSLRFDGWITFIEDRAGTRLGAILKKTRPRRSVPAADILAEQLGQPVE
ncbi:MAG: hypothetical protein AAFX39_14630 [Pseudomonadota bacterium]